MKTSIYRRVRHRAHTNESAHSKNERQPDHSFFGDATHDPFFKPSNGMTAQTSVQLKSDDKKEDDKNVQRKSANPEEKDKIQKKEEKKEEEKVMKKSSEKDKKDEKLQRKETAASSSGTASNYIGSMHGKGNPLSPNANSFFSSRMGYDFSDVKVHTDKEAADSAKELNAKAYTVKNNIVFNQGQYNPESIEGKKLMAHELTHVVQQSSDAGKIQTQPVPLLSPAQETAAVQFTRRNYDERSVRIIQVITGAGVDGVFGSASARAVAAFQQLNGITVNGQVDEATINAMIPGRVAADRREHIVQLVVDFFNIPTSDTLTIHYDPSIGLSPLGATDFEPGNLRIIRLGDLAFLSAGILNTVIAIQLAVPAPALPAITPRPALLSASQEIGAINFNAGKFTDSRSIRIIQGFVQAIPDGVWGRDTVQRIAQFQHDNGLTIDGKVGLQTLSRMSGDLIAASNQNSSIRLIIDYFNLRDNGNLLDVFFDPNETANASTDFRVNEPVRVKVGPSGINQPFEGLVHTIAHEFEHVRRLKEGIAAAPTHEFLGESIEILSIGMPPESLEPLAPGSPGFVAGFADDAGRCIANWNNMPLADQRRFKSKFIAVRRVVRARIAAGTPAQRALHAPLLAAYNAVILP